MAEWLSQAMLIMARVTQNEIRALHYFLRIKEIVWMAIAGKLSAVIHVYSWYGMCLVQIYKISELFYHQYELYVN